MHQRIRITLAVFLAVHLLAPSAGAAGKELLGKWRVMSLEMRGKKESTPKGKTMIVEFAAGGKFFTLMTGGDKTKRKEGTWKVEGNKLTTVVNSITEVMVYSITGNALKLSKVERGHHMFLERASR
jgi:uncharacterized protein (TIGR03066 family)